MQGWSAKPGGGDSLIRQPVSSKLVEGASVLRGPCPLVLAMVVTPEVQIPVPGVEGFKVDVDLAKGRACRGIIAERISAG